ncbi:exosome 3'-_5 exonuclease subunit ski4 (Csl4) [Collariella sp. IMI 366227]|nr:exosome 3'->5 exonuclease subunit ski4 (Csl4) [Collariella sp. IMI 366227]
MTTIAAPPPSPSQANSSAPRPGTHLHDSNLYASLLGQVHLTQPARKTTHQPGPAKRLTKITPAPAPAPTELPTISVAPTPAVVAILVCGDTVLEAEWQGLIRVQDVRATEKDRVRIYESFRPGDVVRAEVISLGDQANYYLSTARNELGVILATSEAGNTMYPVSWKEYRDPETGVVELRKVAKPY